jgi:hypothetical protein
LEVDTLRHAPIDLSQSASGCEYADLSWIRFARVSPWPLRDAELQTAAIGRTRSESAIKTRYRQRERRHSMGDAPL